MRPKSARHSLVFPQDVACAVIRRGEKILITRRRKKDHLGGLWEFPGGKRIGCESLGACLKRELWEELGLRVEPRRFLKHIDYHYPEKWVSLYFYECEITGGRPWPYHCQEFRWIWPFELKAYDFPPADQAVLNLLTSFRV